jgi:hypothetical protein
MPTTEFTTEDQLVSDLVDLWTATRPAGVSTSVPVVHFRRQETVPIPAIIIGHEGFARESAKGMEGTGRTSLRVAIRTDLDVTTADEHRAIAAACDRALLDMALRPGPLALTYLHAILRESPDTVVQDRRQITLLRYLVISTRCSPI